MHASASGGLLCHLLLVCVLWDEQQLGLLAVAAPSRSCPWLQDGLTRCVGSLHGLTSHMRATGEHVEYEDARWLRGNVCEVRSLRVLRQLQKAC